MVTDGISTCVSRLKTVLARAEETLQNGNHTPSRSSVVEDDINIALSQSVAFAVQRIGLQFICVGFEYLDR